MGQTDNTRWMGGSGAVFYKRPPSQEALGSLVGKERVFLVEREDQG